jgi:DNA topoisomerase VI subunit B
MDTRRGRFRSVKELEAAICQYIEVHNEDPTPFVWTRTADQFLASIALHATHDPTYLTNHWDRRLDSQTLSSLLKKISTKEPGSLRWPDRTKSVSFVKGLVRCVQLAACRSVLVKSLYPSFATDVTRSNTVYESHARTLEPGIACGELDRRPAMDAPLENGTKSRNKMALVFVPTSS